jgi:hypothetical protein
MINVDHPHVLNLIQEYRGPNRWDSAAFLIWYLENYYRLDRDEAIDSVCDRENDKGVDGIWINEGDESITVFQSRLIQNPAKTIGDSPLSKFGGTLRQFQSFAGLTAMLNAAGMAQVAQLAQRLNLADKIKAGTYTIRGEFLSNLNIDVNGKGYLPSAPEITFVGKDYLHRHYISPSRDLPKHTRASFDVRGYKCTEYDIDAKTRAIIAPVKGDDLAKLDGIADQSLFAPNVRGPLGKTAINKAIVGSINDPALHSAFLLFHNGVTIISTKLALKRGIITAEDYYVVNGCQSITSLFNHRQQLSKNLRVLAKFILLEKNSPLAATITKHSNTQHGVTDRDFMSNHRIQIRLQHDVEQSYRGDYYLAIKRGEPEGEGKCISNEEVGMYWIAFDFKEPWTTHRKYQVFRERHSQLFARPEATAHRAVMCRIIMDAIDAACARELDNPPRKAFENDLCAKYVLTKYFIMYAMRLMIDKDPIESEVLSEPEKFVHKKNDRKAFFNAMSKVADEIVVDLNYAIKEYGPDFDYRDKMRDETWVKKLANELCATRLKLVQQKRMNTIKAVWDEVDPIVWTKIRQSLDGVAG